MRFRRYQRTDPAINLTSLIDILFIVLVFLVLTTTFREATQLAIELPQAATGERATGDPRDTVRVTVSRDGSLCVSERSVTLAELRDVLMTVFGYPRSSGLARSGRTSRTRTGRRGDGPRASCRSLPPQYRDDTHRRTQSPPSFVRVRATLKSPPGCSGGDFTWLRVS